MKKEWKTLRIDEEYKNKIDMLAKELKINKSQVLRLLVDVFEESKSLPLIQNDKDSVKFYLYKTNKIYSSKCWTSRGRDCGAYWRWEK